jgi:hypothetical protein
MLARLALEVRTDIVYALSAFLTFALVLLPGLGVAWGLGRRARWDVSTILMAAFAFGVAAISAVALFAHYVGLTLDFVLWTALAASAGLWAAGWFLGKGRDMPQLTWQGLALALSAGLLGVLERPWMSYTADTFYHLAAARSLLQFDRPLVTDPFLGTASRVLDPTSGIWHTMLALMSRVTGIDVIWFWPGGLAVSAFFVVLSFWVLARRVSRTDIAATAGTVAYVVFAWYLDFRQFPQPNRVSIALALAAIVGVLMLAKKPSWPAAILAVSASFATFSMHLASAELIVFVLAFIVFWLGVAALVRRLRTGKWGASGFLATGGVALACLVTALPVVLPKAGIVSASNVVEYNAERYSGAVFSVGPLSAVRPGGLIGGGEALFWFAAVIAVLAAVVAFREDDTDAWITLAIVGLPAMVLLNPLVATLMLKYGYYLTMRVALLLRFTPYVGVAWALSRPRAWRWRTQAVALGVAMLIAAALPSQRSFAVVFDPRVVGRVLGEGHAFPVTRFQDQRDKWGRDALKRVAAAVDARYPVVASDPDTSYYAVGLVPVAAVTVKASHLPFAIPQGEANARAADMSLLMNASTSESARRAVLDRRHADYVLVSPQTPDRERVAASMRAQPSLLRPVVDTRTLALFEVVR